MFPFQALENFFRRFNPIDYGEAQAKHIRKQAVEIGIVDLLLDFLAYFAHQKPRCKVLRPSHMDYSHFQVNTCLVNLALVCKII